MVRDGVESLQCSWDKRYSVRNGKSVPATPAGKAFPVRAIKPKRRKCSLTMRLESIAKL